ncbi:MAG: NAD(P)-dependent alcohol dehydrogenase [Candidatus Hydrogenedentes bacterium]|nr:NAD(P)-dependent alcohol dehydrogenase [Candidatus Hydrogenedentota bacterium]
MKAIVCTEYGSPDVLRLADLDKPVPGDGEVLVRIHATSVNAGDWHVLRASPFLVRLVYGVFKPKVTVLGADIAGVVEAVGAGVSRFNVGDAVFGDISRYGFGGFAEYVCVPEEPLAKMPSKLTFLEAAAVPVASVVALQALRDAGKIEAGQNVLIYGASGGVGTFAVPLAKHFGAEVTAVCSTANVERALSLGADRVIDYTKEDFADGDARFDLIIGANGARSIFDFRKALAPKGRYVSSGGATSQFLQSILIGPVLSLAGSRKFVNFLVRPNGADVAFIAGLIEAGLLTPVIDRRYSLAQVPDAIRYLEAGHARGKVVIDVLGGD